MESYRDRDKGVETTTQIRSRFAEAGYDADASYDAGAADEE